MSPKSENVKYSLVIFSNFNVFQCHSTSVKCDVFGTHFTYLNTV